MDIQKKTQDDKEQSKEKFERRMINAQQENKRKKEQFCGLRKTRNQMKR